MLKKISDIHTKYKHYIITIITGAAAYALLEIAGLFEEEFERIMSIANYLTWHYLFEFISILVSFSVFVVSYYTYDQTRNLRTVFLGSVFFTIGMIDMFHTLSFKGMPDFFIENVSANRATTFWILGRLISAIGFLIATIIPPKRKSKIRKEIFLIIPMAISVFLLNVVTYHPDFFPPMFIEEYGLTKYKIYSEYLIVILFAVVALILIYEYKKKKDNVIFLFVLSLIISIFSEMAFVLYESVYDIYNYLGHIYKFIAFFLIFRGVLISSIKKPYLQLHRAKEQLKDHAENLDKKVYERTIEIKKLNDRLLDDIKYARSIQESMFSFKVPENKNISFEVRYFPAERISGDFYSIFKIDEGNIAFYIGDVSGHGVPAAMLTIFLNQTVRSLLDLNNSKGDLSPGSILDDTYKAFNKTNFGDDVYIVMLFGVYNIKSGRLKWSSAGHNVEPLIIKKNGKIHEIKIKGFPICKLIEIYNEKYQDHITEIEPGDRVMFYTDGLIEARNSSGEFYGTGRLENVLKSNLNKPLKYMADVICDSVFEFMGSKNTQDDITFFILERREQH
ncbi:MASE3 domain-containing protein [Acetivibrio saccincola]|uniref:Serine/threonine protein phosphatase n=2 Tax=Acetivibrio saccincola TaxID=1677857 RepID=A0A2S8RB68_9FIRM|nr:MASE3 domain-containing protein [Acetivibrio saccincola]PQQ67025.1 serine/threonine protein phosphatase [Acetivibrio saccincola]